jgi:pimeloyl-ACP methyl ester carboxylesterase
VSEELNQGRTEPVPHWPGRLISLGDHEVYLRSVAPAPAADAFPFPAPFPAAAPVPVPVKDTATLAGPALCVHGLEGSSRNWTDLMDLLRPRLDAEAVDLPGFGDSPPRPDGRYSIAAMAQTITKVIEHRNRGPVHLISNSLSAPSCVKVAAARPELIRSLTLVSPALPDSRPRMDLLRFPLMCVPGVGTRLIRAIRLLPPERRVADVIWNCFSDPQRFAPQRFAAEVAELTRRDTFAWPPAALVGSARALTADFFHVGRGSTWRAATQVQAPSLIIYGADDPLVGVRMAGRAARAFSHGRVVVMPSTGHLAHMEHPALVAAEIGVLLDAQAGPAAATQAREFPLTHAG